MHWCVLLPHHMIIYCAINKGSNRTKYFCRHDVSMEYNVLCIYILVLTSTIYMISTEKELYGIDRLLYWNCMTLFLFLVPFVHSITSSKFCPWQISIFVWQECFNLHLDVFLTKGYFCCFWWLLYIIICNRICQSFLDKARIKTMNSRLLFFEELKSCFLDINCSK